MNELKKSLKTATSLCQINDIMKIAEDEITGLTKQQLDELQRIAMQQRQKLYRLRY